MGTNYYVAESKGRGTHIGKRSAAGAYCWDCKVTLCKAGESQIHYGQGDNTEWYKACPICGKAAEEESLTNSASGRELGFNKSKPAKKKGVKSCSSFTWAIKPTTLNKLLTKRKYSVVDEYDRKFTKEQFKAVLKECPVRYTRLVGQEFC